VNLISHTSNLLPDDKALLSPFLTQKPSVFHFLIKLRYLTGSQSSVNETTPFSIALSAIAGKWNRSCGSRDNLLEMAVGLVFRCRDPGPNPKMASQVAAIYRACAGTYRVVLYKHEFFDQQRVFCSYL
jgi:hypothetical protein